MSVDIDHEILDTAWVLLLVASRLHPWARLDITRGEHAVYAAALTPEQAFIARKDAEMLAQRAVSLLQSRGGSIASSVSMEAIQHYVEQRCYADAAARIDLRRQAVRARLPRRPSQGVTRSSVCLLGARLSTLLPQEKPPMDPSPKKKRGFALMSESQRKLVASRGGREAHARGAAHAFTSDEAQEAGRKGGLAAHARGTAHAFTIEDRSRGGRKGGRVAASLSPTHMSVLGRRGAAAREERRERERQERERRELAKEHEEQEG